MIEESKSWTLKNIQQLIDNQVKESPYLEYKSCAGLTKEGAINSISKTISSFANAGGGVTIYGIKEDPPNPIELDIGYNPKEVSKEWLEQVILSNIQPKIESFYINPVELGTEYENRVLYVVSIPQSDRAPHQAFDKKFYTRQNFLSEPMEEYEIRDVFNRKRAPNIVLDLFIRRLGARIDKFPLSTVNSETIHGIEFNGALKNDGGGEVNFAVIKLFIDRKIIIESTREQFKLKPLKMKVNDKDIDVYGKDINWGGQNKMPLFRTVSYRLSKEDIPINFNVSWLKEKEAPIILWEIKAPGMEPNKGMVRLRIDTEDKAYLDFESEFEYSNITQDDRNREFLANPDLSIDPEID